MAFVKLTIFTALVALALGDIPSSYNAPAAPSFNSGPAFNAPAQSFNSAPSFNAPAPSFDAPEPSYNAPTPSYNAPAPQIIVPAKYDFNYAVKDDYAGSHFGQQETRDGYDTQGSYYVQLPDGRLQKVAYSVNGDSGYVAQVSYEGEAQYPQPQPSQGYQSAPLVQEYQPAAPVQAYQPVAPVQEYQPAPAQEYQPALAQQGYN